VIEGSDLVQDLNVPSNFLLSTGRLCLLPGEMRNNGERMVNSSIKDVLGRLSKVNHLPNRDEHNVAH
jgi:hypothetical protein